MEENVKNVNQNEQNVKQDKKEKKDRNYVNPIIAWGSIAIELVIVGAVSLIVALI